MLARWSADRMNARKTARMVGPLPTFCPQQRRPDVHAREPWKSRPRFAIRTDCRSAAALKRARPTSLGSSRQCRAVLVIVARLCSRRSSDAAGAADTITPARATASAHLTRDCGGTVRAPRERSVMARRGRGLIGNHPLGSREAM
jgi:hypothetical protein